MMLVPYKKDYCAETKKGYNILHNKNLSNEEKLRKHKYLQQIIPFDKTSSPIESTNNNQLDEQTKNLETQLQEKQNEIEKLKQVNLEQREQSTFNKLRTLLTKPVENIDINPKKKRNLVRLISNKSSYTPSLTEDYVESAESKKRRRDNERFNNNDEIEEEEEFINKVERQYIKPNTKITRASYTWQPY